MFEHHNGALAQYALRSQPMHWYHNVYNVEPIAPRLTNKVRKCVSGQTFVNIKINIHEGIVKHCGTLTHVHKHPSSVLRCQHQTLSSRAMSRWSDLIFLGTFTIWRETIFRPFLPSICALGHFEQITKCYGFNDSKTFSLLIVFNWTYTISTPLPHKTHWLASHGP